MSFERKTVGELLNIRGSLTDHIGIEIEVEGENLPRVDTSFWKSEEDRSLRGESYEYVLRKPLPFKNSSGALKVLKASLDEHGSQIKNSPNAGVHVHINCSDLTVTQLFNFVSLYLVAEEVLVRQCGEHRVGNLFCLRASDAEYMVDMLALAIRNQDLRCLHTDELRYASVNVKALGDYGSIEFRAWRSDGDFEAISWWCELLKSLKHKAREMHSPADIVHAVSNLSPQGFFNLVLGEFVKDVPWTNDYESAISNGVRHVQRFAYLGDW